MSTPLLVNFINKYSWLTPLGQRNLKYLERDFIVSETGLLLAFGETLLCDGYFELPSVVLLNNLEYTPSIKETNYLSTIHLELI